MTTGQNIHHFRLLKQMTQAQLADAIGTTTQNISQYERGVRNPKLETLRKIALALDCNISDLDSSLSSILADAVFSPESRAELSDAANNMMVALYGTADEWKARKAVFARWVDTLSEDDKKSVFGIIKYLQNLNSEGKITAAERVEELTQIPKYQDKAPDN